MSTNNNSRLLQSDHAVCYCTGDAPCDALVTAGLAIVPWKTNGIVARYHQIASIPDIMFQPAGCKTRSPINSFLLSRLKPAKF